MLLLFCLIRNKTPKSCRRIVTFCHSGEILSNLVTLFKDNDKKHWPNFVYFQFRVHFPKLVTNSRTANCSNNAYSNKKWWREGDSNSGPQDASLLSYGSPPPWEGSFSVKRGGGSNRAKDWTKPSKNNNNTKQIKVYIFSCFVLTLRLAKKLNI